MLTVRVERCPEGDAVCRCFDADGRLRIGSITLVLDAACTGAPAAMFGSYGGAGTALRGSAIRLSAPRVADGSATSVCVANRFELALAGRLTAGSPGDPVAPSLGIETGSALTVDGVFRSSGTTAGGNPMSQFACPRACPPCGASGRVCPLGEFCGNGACTAPNPYGSFCTEAAHCPQGSVCASTTTGCVAGPCSTSASCPAAPPATAVPYCSAQICRLGCTAAGSTCPSGMRCDGSLGYCVR
jgi:hypothetical protein